MRPLELEFQAFGSFPGIERVDFSVLQARGLFVVTGPTGAGKTTVFDALTYALFGEVPGDRPDREVRSHHADSSVPTYVQFEFEVERGRYLIRRTPTYDRPKLRGEGTTEEKATANLVRIGDDGTHHPVATKVTDCTRACIELVGLTADQFQRVVLLPQGKFSSFLLARSSDREPLLRQLFGGEVYQRATRFLNEQVKSLKGEVGGVEERIRRHQETAREELETVRQAWSPESEPLGDDATDAEVSIELGHLRDQIPARRSAVDQLAAASALATTEWNRIVDVIRNWEQRATLQRRVTELEALRRQRELETAQLEAARLARPVVAEHDTASARRAAADLAADALRAATGRISDALDTLDLTGVPFTAASLSSASITQRNELADRRRTLLAASDAVNELAGALDLHAAAQRLVDQADESLIATETSLGEHSKRCDALVPLAATVDRCRADHERAATVLDRRTRLDATVGELGIRTGERDVAHLAYLDAMQRYIATEAPRLARELRDHEPCPVCGSVEHPAPATLDHADPVDHDLVDTARLAHHELTATVARLDQASNELRAELGDDAELPIAVLTERVATTDNALAEATSAAAELVALQGATGALHRAVEGARSAAADARSALAVADAGVLSRRAFADRAAADAEAIDVADVDRCERAVDALDELLDRLHDLQTEATTTATSASDAEQALTAVLRASGYRDVDEARAAALPTEIEESLDALGQQWRAEIDDVMSRLCVYDDMELPDELPDGSAAEVRAAEAGQASSQAHDVFTGNLAALDRCQAALDRVGDIVAGSVELRARHDVARRVLATCNGESASRISLETWVLAGELERVTSMANAHLARMSAHRYQLERVDTASRGRAGLDLVVRDAHTGRSRATATLSGGEQFQASLALALGLADVVSHGGTSSGRAFDALFVDEGFGSLDPEALDQAIAALQQLQAGGRMVGAITHVEAMKQQLPVGIDVRRLPESGGSTLVVT